ncbi:MAG TPA: HNH endonuclease signature motif containing protein [Verrucomicrobiota bacterium]|nr:HNH endonuclease signature motif containing protein [Verrucomicrobiota bacterium]
MAGARLNSPSPFAYPAQIHTRRHGPVGYSHYRQYRNWLRDEFTFRCVYCLRRENWLTLSADWEIDHFLPKSDHPDVARDYDNLVYACNRCNRTKAAKYLPDPERFAYGQCIRVDDEGRIHWLTEEGRDLIEALGLDDEDYTRMRRKVLSWLREARPGGKIYTDLLGFPDNLPDLSKEDEPPLGNKRPHGIGDSWFERSKRPRFPRFY